MAARGFGAALALLLLLLAPAAFAAPNLQTIGHGGVVQLAGTPHLFVSWEGQLHWAGDTRALAGRVINWSERHTLDLATLRRYAIGDPWLSTGLVKWGDPIYLAKWEANECCPRLLHIQAIADVELFGINGNNYGRFVIEQTEWERRTGFSAASLARAPLERAVAATPTPRPLPTATPRPIPTAISAPLPGIGTVGAYGVVQIVDWSLPSCSDVIATAIFLNRGNPDGLARALQGVRCNPLEAGGGSPASPSAGLSSAVSPLPRPADSDLTASITSVGGISRTFPTIDGRVCNTNRYWKATNIRLTFEFYYTSLLSTLDSGNHNLSREVRANTCQSFSASLTALQPWLRINIRRVEWTWAPN